MKTTAALATLATLGGVSAAFAPGNNRFTIQHNGVTREANVSLLATTLPAQLHLSSTSTA